MPLAIVLALSVPALAQTVPGWTSGILVSYNLADVEAADPLAGFAAELDLRFGGLPISFVGHVSSTDPQSYTGAGLRITHDVGPLEIFGHYLFGSLKTGTDATDGVDQRRGGGVNVPINERLFLDGWAPTTAGGRSTPSSGWGRAGENCWQGVAQALVGWRWWKDVSGRLTARCSACGRVCHSAIAAIEK